MGNPTPVVIIADHKTTPEGSAIQQFERVASFDHIHAAAAMPDLHPGRGYPVGAAFFSESHLYPALIGGDIGCGMALWQTDLAARKHSADKLLRRIGDLESPLGDDWQVAITARLGMGDIPYRHALGTIGGGNHFAEIQRVDAVLAPAQLPPDFDAEALYLFIHSGSRGYGGEILRTHIELHGHAPLAANSADAVAYLAAHDAACAYATANRALIAARLAQQLGCAHRLISDSIHNQLVAHADGWLHRKGAAPADSGLVVIAGSRGSHSYLVRPTGLDTGNLASLAHGAGRKWQRGACKARLSAKYRPAELARNPFGGHVICADKTLLYDEAPQAYRNIEYTIAALVAHGLIEPVARLAPLITYKTRGGCRMISLQISAAQGPGECQRAAAHVRDYLLQEAQAAGVRAHVTAENHSAHGIHSAVIELQGENAAAFAARWTGTIQWIWQSRIRPKHRRKNWYIGVFPLASARDIPRGNITIQTCKASGKGGQHVNKTRSAVWAEDAASGLRVKVQAERSQHANKRLALARLHEQHAARQLAADAEQRADARQQHWQLERGNPVRVFVGDDFHER